MYSISVNENQWKNHNWFSSLHGIRAHIDSFTLMFFFFSSFLYCFPLTLLLSNTIMTTPHSTNITSIASPPNTEIPLITINISAQAPLKLTSTNYLSWKLQFETLFIGYDLIGYIDGSKPCPPTTITANNTATTNPSHKLWIRQDQLLLNALIGSLSLLSFPSLPKPRLPKKHGPSLPIPMTNPHMVASNKLKPNLRIQQKVARM